MISYLDCPHHNIQQFTECCLDCGYNIYTSKSEYLKDLKRKLADRYRREVESSLEAEIRQREQQLEIPRG